MKTIFFILAFASTASAGGGYLSDGVSKATGDSLYVNVTGGDTMTGQLILSGSTLTVTGPLGVSVTYGVTAGTFTGNGAALTNITAANISAGSLGASVMASSVALVGFYSAPEVRTALGVPGLVDINTFTSSQTVTAGGGLQVVYEIKAGSVSVSNTSANALDVAGGINAGTGNVAIIDATGKITALSSTYLADLSGANLTSLTAANISAGSLGSGVIASSIAVDSVYDGAILDPKLSLASGGTVVGAVTMNGALNLVSTGTATNLTIQRNTTWQSNGISFKDEIGDNQAQVRVNGQTSNDLQLVAATNQDIRFFTESDMAAGTPSNERMVILNSGNVGIGTTAPATLLDVNGTAQFGSGVAKSTFTAAGVLTMGAAIRNSSLTLAQLQVLVPGAVGEQHYCSNCSPKKTVISTGTSAGNWADAIGGTFQ